VPDIEHHWHMVRRVVVLVIGLVLAAPVAILAAPLRAGDHVAVSVFNHPELSVTQATIDSDGKLVMPLVGNVAVAGLEPEIAADRIGTALKPYLRQPVVTVAVAQQNGTISVVGGPASSLPYVPGQTLSSVVATLTATPGLDLHHVSLVRDGVPYGSYDGADLLRHAQPGPLLAPGDQVILAQKPVAVDVLGMVRTPGMTYLDTGATIGDAVNAAGGTADGAATGSLDLLRAGVHQRIALTSDAAQQPVVDGDVIGVPKAVHVAVGGSVAHPGDTPLINGTTLIAAVYQAGGPVRYADVSHTEVIHDGVRHVYDVTKVPHGDASQNPHLSEGDIVNIPRGNYVNFGDIFAGLGVIHWFF